MNRLKWLFVSFLCFFLVSACIPEWKWSGPGANEPRDGPGSEHIVNLEVPEDPAVPVSPLEDPQYQDGESVYGDFIIENVGYVEYEGKEYIFGDVINTSSNNTYAWAEIEIVLADGDMNHLEYIYTNIDQLGPGEKWEFITVVPNISFKYYHIRDVYGSIQEQLNELNAVEDLSIVEHSAIYDGDNYIVLGTVQNHTQKRYAYVDLLIYIYDEKEIKVEQIQPSITDLGPGETWNFEAIINASNASTYEIIEIYGY